mgnify:CR=1 FL=1
MKKILLSLLFPLALFAEEQTTGNLITNGTFNNGTTGWTLSGNAQRIGDCCPGGHDLEFGDSGSIEQSFNLSSETITQPMLNNGITLNSSVEVQNGECAVSGCWGGSGGADTFTIRLQIKDSDSNVLATTTQERTNVTGINGEDFTDTLSYTGSDSNIGNIFISGSDANSPATLGGPNVDNISVTMTYDDEVLTATQTTELNTTFQEITEVVEIIEEIIPETFEELFVEEVVLEGLILELLPEIIEIGEEEKFIEEEIVLSFLQTQPLSTVEELTVVEEPVEEITTELIEEVYEESNETPMEVKNEETEIEETSRQRVASSEEESTGIEEVSSQNSTESEKTESKSVNENELVSTETDTTRENTNEIPQTNTVVSINVEKIAEKVAEKVKSISQQLKITQIIVAKAMNNNKILDSYNNINQDIFNNQPIIAGGNYYETREYIDVRNIYNQNQNVYNDMVARYQKQIQQATDEVIRTEEHLRRIRGF